MYCWNARTRLTPMRLVWLEHNYNEPRFMDNRRKGLRAYTICDQRPALKVEADRERRQRWPGLIARWPLQLKKLPKKKSSKSSGILLRTQSGL